MQKSLMAALAHYFGKNPETQTTSQMLMEMKAAIANAVDRAFFIAELERVGYVITDK